MPKAALLLTVVCIAVACASAALGFVNPQLQPLHLVERHRTVVGLTVTEVDFDNGVVKLKAARVCFGRFAPQQVTIEVREVDFDEDSLLDEIEAGDTVVAFVGKLRARHEQDVLLYAGSQWHEVKIVDPQQPGEWEWLAALGDEMVGTFNGAAEQLLRMMADAAAGRYHFPALPLVKFREPLEIGRFEGPLRGVALYDLDGDGRLDIYACCEQGNRAYLQAGPLKFVDRTGALGLEGIKGRSCSLADVNADGRVDLLADGVIYLGSPAGFSRGDLLPPGADQDVKCAAFVELSGDGHPDVLVSRVGRGLACYCNPGAAGGRFVDATAAAGLDQPECGAGGTGFFACGDFDGDHRTDIYYAAGKGLILLQQADGSFAPFATGYRFDYKASGTDQPGMTGGGCFAALRQPDSRELVAAGDMHLTILALRGERLSELTRWGNEIRLGRVRQLATLAEDLNADGTLDLLTLTREAGVENVFHCNRGYGSYMLSELYMDYDGLPGESFATGAWGVAAGDVNDDGLTDLVFGGADGVLRLSLNDALSHDLRRPVEHPTELQRVLAQTRLLTVRVLGKRGVVGAEVTLLAADGRVVARRTVGSQILTGCCGPTTVNLAVRQPGAYRLSVQFSDGTTHEWPVDLTEQKRIAINAAHPNAQQDM